MILCFYGLENVINCYFCGLKNVIIIMYRTVIEKLKEWKEKKDRLPIILLGARQVGKTWLMKEFGRSCFADVCYVNFEEPGDLRDLFEGNINVDRIIEYLGILHGKKIEKQTTLLIFDEVQQVPRALTSLKYFAENAPEYALCCAGSLLGVTLHSGTSFPVGKVEFLQVSPMSFCEFLLANGEDSLVEYLKKHYEDSIPEILAEKLQDYLKKYFIIGGMPQAVSAWVQNGDFEAVRKIQLQILESYKNDFSKHAPNNTVPKIHHVWNSIPSQLAKANKKFIYGVAKQGARAREYEDALLWLKDSGVIRHVGLVEGGRLPLKAYEDLKSFKIYHLDLGLLCAMCEIAPSVILNKTNIFSEFNGSLTEQFVLQELQNSGIAQRIYYWSEGDTSEVDFLFSYGANVIPVEAKAGLNVHAQSLKVFMKKYDPQIAVRTSLQPFRKDGSLLNLPLYELWLLPDILKH